MSGRDVFEYIRQYYGLNFRLGQRVRTSRGEGVIVGATHYIRVRLDGETVDGNWHPTDVESIGESEESREQ